MDEALLDLVKAPEIINVASLGEWLKACESHGVDHISAEKIGECWAGEIMLWANREPGPKENMGLLYKHVSTRLRRGNDMLRWDCCAPGPFKRAMSETGWCWEPDRWQVFAVVNDTRLLSILEDWPKFQPVALWRRPWFEPLRHEGWPVEFRVFVEDHQVRGVSNYYPQVSLPSSFEQYAARAAAMTGPLLDCAPTFTADWLLTVYGDLKYLEGGPGHTSSGGAHPCCFAPGDVNGVALSPEPGAAV